MLEPLLDIRIKINKQQHDQNLFINQGYKEGRKEERVLFNDTLDTLNTFMDIWDMVEDHSITREETCCHHMGCSFQLAARVLLYASSHRLNNTYHSLCYTSRGALAGTRNSSMGPPWRIDPTTHRSMSYISLHIIREKESDSLMGIGLKPNHPRRGL